jgi:hypothetical protein
LSPYQLSGISEQDGQIAFLAVLVNGSPDEERAAYGLFGANLINERDFDKGILTEELVDVL